MKNGLLERLSRRENTYEKITGLQQNPAECIRTLIERADAVVIGAGSGLSTAAGLTYSEKRFTDNFAPFIKKYGMKDMYSAGFYPFDSQEEKWAYWSRHIYLNRYDIPTLKVYQNLLEMVKNKAYFVLTTNVDHQFQNAGFPEEKVFATQGDYGLFQCARACHNKLYDNESLVRAMVAEQTECRIPAALIPKCPVCGGDMEVNLRCDSYFVEDEAWHRAAKRYNDFLNKHRKDKVVFVELGVGMNTPGIIKYPFWKMTYEWQEAVYICINKGQAWVPDEIADKSVVLDADIAAVWDEILNKRQEEGVGQL